MSGPSLLAFIRAALRPGLGKRLLRRFRPRQVMFMGDHSYGNPKVVCFKGPSEPVVRIGKYSSIADGVTFLLNEVHPHDRYSTFPFRIRWLLEGAYQDGWPVSKGDIIVGNDVWIGYNALILSGITISDGAMIGAGCVVRANVPPYAVVTGNPMRISGYRFDEETIARLLEMKWWEWSDDKVRENLDLLTSRVSEGTSK